MADETEKITYEIVIDDSKATASANKVSDSFDKIEDSTKKATGAVKDHSAALDKAVPGFSNLTGGIQNAIMAAKAFIATPLGLVIGAIGLAVAALTAYFKGSEEGQDRLAKITAVLNVAFEKLKQVLEFVGEAIFDVIDGTATFEDKLGFLGKALDASIVPLKLLLIGLQKIADLTGASKVIDEVVAAGKKIAALEDEIDARENDMIVKRAETNKKVFDLREKAIKEEGAQKKKTIQEAIDLEKELSAEEVKQAQARYDLQLLQDKQTGKLTEEQKKRQAELLAAKINAESQAAQNTLRLQKEVEALNDAAAKKAADESKKQIEAAQKAADEKVKVEKDLFARLGKIGEQWRQDQKEAREQQIHDKIADEELDKQLAERKKKRLDKETEDAKKQAQIDKLIQAQKLANTSLILGQVSGLLDQKSAEYKAFAIAQSSIDTYRAATAALAEGGGFPFGEILAGITIAIGLANVAKIAGFAEGGISGTRITKGMGKSIYRSNGDNMLATVRTGEVILNENQQAALGGARTFSAIGVPGFASGGITDSQLTNSLNNSFIDSQANSDRNVSNLINAVRASSQKVLVIEDVENLINQRIGIRETATL